MARTILLASGIVASILYIGTDIVASTQWTNYAMSSQTVSELIAVDAPTRSLVIPLFAAYSLLTYAFGAGIWMSSGPKPTLRVAGAMLIAKEVLGLIGSIFFPIHLRGVPATYTDAMHGVVTGVGVLCLLVGIGFAAAALGGGFRTYSILTIIAMMVTGAIAGRDAPLIEANQPTPYLGILERITIYSFLMWVTALAAALIRRNRSPGISNIGSR